MKLRIGSRVLCIKDCYISRYSYGYIKGNYYIISDIEEYSDGGSTVWIYNEESYSSYFYTGILYKKYGRDFHEYFITLKEDRKQKLDILRSSSFLVTEGLL